MANRLYTYNNMPKLTIEHRKQIITHIFISSRGALSQTISGGIIIDLLKIDDDEHAVIRDMIDKRLYR